MRKTASSAALKANAAGTPFSSSQPSAKHLSHGFSALRDQLEDA